jgi:hypothetical protein
MCTNLLVSQVFLPIEQIGPTRITSFVACFPYGAAMAPPRGQRPSCAVPFGDAEILNRGCLRRPARLLLTDGADAEIMRTIRRFYRIGPKYSAASPICAVSETSGCDRVGAAAGKVSAGRECGREIVSGREAWVACPGVSSEPLSARSSKSARSFSSEADPASREKNASK